MFFSLLFDCEVRANALSLQLRGAFSFSKGDSPVAFEVLCSKELLAFLLDGLHEDLYRVKHKPYINSRDADGPPDEEVADEYWENHIARNDSIIVDVCQGQYKSILVCPVCNKVCLTFDPFMYLSLPLQFTTTRTMTITVFTCDGSVLPSTCTVTVLKQERYRDLIQALSNACSLKQTEEIKLVEARAVTHSDFLLMELSLCAKIGLSCLKLFLANTKSFDS
ncbi:hypothetical protein CRYUN_Cryun41cG0058800 [Craigia yunnanensis]